MFFFSIRYFTLEIIAKVNSIWYPFLKFIFLTYYRVGKVRKGAQSNFQLPIGARLEKYALSHVFWAKKVENILWKPIRLLSRRSLRGASWIFLRRKILSRNRFRLSSLQEEKIIWSVVIRVVRLNEKRGNTVLLFMADMKKRTIVLRKMDENCIVFVYELKNIKPITTLFSIVECIAIFFRASYLRFKISFDLINLIELISWKPTQL